MNDEQKKEITERFNKLPQELREAIAQVETLPILQEIATKYKLDAYSRTALRNEIVLVLCGETKIDDFSFNLVEAIPLIGLDTAVIEESIKRGVFVKVSSALEKLAEPPPEELEPEVIDKVEVGNEETATPIVQTISPTPSTLQEKLSKPVTTTPTSRQPSGQGTVTSVQKTTIPTTSVPSYGQTSKQRAVDSGQKVPIAQPVVVPPTPPPVPSIADQKLQQPVVVPSSESRVQSLKQEEKSSEFRVPSTEFKTENQEPAPPTSTPPSSTVPQQTHTRTDPYREDPLG